MILTIDRRLIDAIYAPRVKLFVSSADLAALGAGLDRAALGANGIELIQFQSTPAADGEARLLSPGAGAGEFIKLVSPPTGPCVIAAATPQGRADLATLLEWWKKHGADRSPEMLELNGAASSGAAAWQSVLYRHLFEMARTEAQCSAERETHLCGQLYELRQEYEQARGAMQLMQERLERLNHASCQMTYCLAPSAERYRPSREGETLRQRLPVPAAGLAGFNLYSPPGSSSVSGDERLMVTLRAREAEVVLGTWTVRGDQLGRGWVHFAFPVALVSPYHQLELVLHWTGVSEGGAGLALSTIDPWHELTAVVDDKPLGAALAHVVWTTYAGAKLSLASVPFHPANGSVGSDVFECLVSRDEIVRLIPTSPTSVGYLVPLPDKPGFRLHPLDGILASAVLPNICLPGTQAVSSIVKITNPAARYPIEYAIALTEAGAGQRTFPVHPEAAGVVGMSGWQLVPPDGASHVVGLSLAAPAAVALDLHVATRMANGSPTAHAWADWHEVRMTLRYATPMLMVER